jgi:hypothetical protein
MGARPSHDLVKTLRKVLRQLEEATDPGDPALARLKSILLRRIADIEVAGASQELEPLGRSIPDLAE